MIFIWKTIIITGGDRSRCRHISAKFRFFTQNPLSTAALQPLDLFFARRTAGWEIVSRTEYDLCAVNKLHKSGLRNRAAAF